MKEDNEMEQQMIEKLVLAATAARENAIASFSNYMVGAALLSADGRVFTGCNIESSVMAPSLCAERVAIAKAISEGVTDFLAIAVVGAKRGERPDIPCFPCGICRQVLSEYVSIQDFSVYVVEDGEAKRFALSELLPHSFSL